MRVYCAGWGAMFIPDSNDRPYDWAGLSLLLATILLTVGAALALSNSGRCLPVRVTTQSSRRARTSRSSDASTSRSWIGKSLVVTDVTSRNSSSGQRSGGVSSCAPTNEP